MKRVTALGSVVTRLSTSDGSFRRGGGGDGLSQRCVRGTPARGSLRSQDVGWACLLTGCPPVRGPMSRDGLRAVESCEGATCSAGRAAGRGDPGAGHGLYVWRRLVWMATRIRPRVAKVRTARRDIARRRRLRARGCLPATTCLRPRSAFRPIARTSRPRPPRRRVDLNRSAVRGSAGGRGRSCTTSYGGIRAHIRGWEVRSACTVVRAQPGSDEPGGVPFNSAPASRPARASNLRFSTGTIRTLASRTSKAAWVAALSKSIRPSRRQFLRQGARCLRIA